ncbi:MAG: protein-methionine-sulfoxide reductase catalytic subunit MsrP [Cyanobacteria bacterium P01_D01_bin.105]
MPFPRIQPDWQLPEKHVTSENVFFNRRRFMKLATGAGLGMTGAITLSSCRPPLSKSDALAFETTLGAPIRNFSQNPAFQDLTEFVTEQQYASRFNNFYEFGGTKNIWENAQSLPSEDWKLAITGLVNNPTTYDADDLLTTFPLEERIYRFRCVEAWAMVVPWLGFPMNKIIQAVEPKPEAKYVRFESFYDPDITKGPFFPAGFSSGNLPWPYQEGLTIEEMNNELAFFAVGVYGRTLPKQNGAPIRMVVPWKYGFKGAKSIVKIEFTATQPATYWNSISPNEYGFSANVNPLVSHPRWSQANERLMGAGNDWDWKKQPTLPYNGYGAYVASLYG